MLNLQWQPQHPVYRSLLKAFLVEAGQVYVVGGVVRDFIIAQDGKSHVHRKTAIPDLDLVLEEDVLSISRRIADRQGWAFYKLDEQRELARLVNIDPDTQSQLVCDVAKMRGDTIEEDLRSRDFTVNAMAFVAGGLSDDYNVENSTVKLVDVCGGQIDLEQALLRRVSVQSLPNDPVRLLRAVRLSMQFGLTIEPETRSQIAEMAAQIRLGSPERIRDELWKALQTDNAATAIEEMRVLGLLPHVLPEVDGTVGIEQSSPHRENVYRHTLNVVRRVSSLRNWLDSSASIARDADNIQHACYQMLEPWRAQLQTHFNEVVSANRTRVHWLVWHALLHDIGKPQTRTVETQSNGSMRHRFLKHERVGADLAQKRLQSLRFSQREIALSQTVIKGHMRPHLLVDSFGQKAFSRRAIYRFFRYTENKQLQSPAGIDIILLALADYMAIYTAKHLEQENYQELYRNMGQSTAQIQWSDHHIYLDHMHNLLSYHFDEVSQLEKPQQPLINGTVLMEHLGISPGRQVGQILEQLSEAQAVGEIHSQEEALELASRWLHEKAVIRNG